MMDLQELYREFAVGLPSDEDTQNEAVVFDAASVPPPPLQLETAALSILRRTHSYLQALRVDLAYLFATPEVYRQLGLLCLGVLLHEDIDVVDLTLTDPSSELKAIRIRHVSPKRGRYGTDDARSYYTHGYNVMPLALQYWVSERDRRPDFLPEQRPHVQLTSAREDLIEVPRGQKTHLVLSSRDQFGFGLATMAELLIDLGAPQPHGEFALEMPDDSLGPANGGVSFGSAELRLCLLSDPPSDVQAV